MTGFHKNEEEMAASLAKSIGGNLMEAFEKRGRALLVLPGGSSPRLLIRMLARTSQAWNKIEVTTTDERCVDIEDENSNAGQIMRLAAAENAAIKPVRLWPEDQEAIEGLSWPADVVVIGMGTDGHIASIFPGMDGAGKGRVIPATAPAEPKKRVSLTLESLLDARRVILLAPTPGKWALCQDAMDGKVNDLPVAALIQKAGKKLEIHALNPS